MLKLSALLERVFPNPWAIATREGRSARLKLLADMAGMLLGNADPDAVLRLLMDKAPRDLGLDVVISYVADAPRRMLHATYAGGVTGKFADQLDNLPFGTGICGTVAETRKPLAFNELVWNHDPVTSIVRQNGFRAYASFPLLAGSGAGELLGVLSFGSKREDYFQPEDIEFFSTVVHHAAAVHERKRAERAIRESELQFRTLADSIAQFTWMARPDGSIFWYNKRWYDYTGTAFDEMRGWGWEKVHHPDHLARVTESYRRSLASGEPWEDTFPLHGRNGEWRWFLSRALPVRAEDGRIVMWFGTNTDVTDLREAEQALRAARDEAEATRREAELANLSKSKFLAAASHDLRQPMQSMLLLANVLERQVESEAARRTLLHLQRGMDALKGLLDGLLDISRLDAGAITPEVRDFPLNELCEQIASTYEPVAAGKGLEWSWTPCNHMVRSDPTLLGRIVRNLVENAVRYTEHGYVHLTCSSHGGHARIAVEDSGVGIPPEHLSRIWDEFHQVGNSERDRVQGTGLGLAIVHRLAALLDHPVTVKSTPGGGSVFTVTIPLSVQSQLPDSIDKCADIADACGRSVLLIDDDAMVLLSLQALFRAWGYRAIIAGSGDQALEQLNRTGLVPDILVSDYRLRGGEKGTDVILTVRNRLGVPIPGIVLTGETNREAERKAAELGLGFIHKPVTARQLSAALQTSLTTAARKAS